MVVKYPVAPQKDYCIQVKHALHGQQWISNNHYTVFSISDCFGWPPCHTPGHLAIYHGLSAQYKFHCTELAFVIGHL